MNGLQTNALEKKSGNNFQNDYSAAPDSTGAPNVSDTEHPVAIRFRGITLTPGGFFDTTGIYRCTMRMPMSTARSVESPSPEPQTRTSANFADRRGPHACLCWPKAKSITGKLQVMPRLILKVRRQLPTNWRATVSIHGLASCGRSWNSIMASPLPAPDLEPANNLSKGNRTQARDGADDD